MNPWIGSRLPRGPAAVLGVLHLHSPNPGPLDSLDDSEWRQAMEFADRSGLTLLLRRAAGSRFPQWLRDRTERDAAHNRIRLQRTEALYRTLDETLRRAGIEYIALKGLTQSLHFATPPEDRVQFDVDLFVSGDLKRAGELVQALGFAPYASMEKLPTDHLPTLIEKGEWKWRGDYFDPDLPLSVDLHFQFWSPEVERIAVSDVDQFWGRRTVRRVAGIEMPVMSASDALGYTALHLLRHVLRGSARPFHVYEIAGFLETHAADQDFWREWRSLHSPQLRRLQAVVFRLAAEWFGCQLGATAEEEVSQLPSAVKKWFDRFPLAPAEGIFFPHKDELWLHWSLVHCWRDRLATARLRLFPLNAPAPNEWNSGAMTAARRLRYAAHAAARAKRHIAALPHALRTGVAWWLG